MFRSRKHSSSVYSLRGSRRRAPLLEIASEVNWLIILGFLVGLAVSLYAINISAIKQPKYVGPATFAFILIGWLFSLTLHEFGHASAAFLNGDRSDSTRRYLSANPLLYLHPILSIVLPLAFVLLGGIGLPGGAVYLQRGYYRQRWRDSVISLAGPAGNLVVLLALVALFQIAVRTGFLGLEALSAIGFLAFLQVSAILLNLIPIPGLDGYGAIEPYLSAQTRASLEGIRPYGYILVFVLLYLPALNNLFFTGVGNVLGLTGIDPAFAYIGLGLFQFWRPQQ